ncbi:MAG: hypothetical protein PHE47_03195 [Oscillospiraceae bacterium]|nr:hypothetical protein [Oscillospiraceae bacterium]
MAATGIAVGSLYYLAKLGNWVFTGQNHIDRHIPDRLLVGVFYGLLAYGVLRNIPMVPFTWLQPL